MLEIPTKPLDVNCDPIQADTFSSLAIWGTALTAALGTRKRNRCFESFQRAFLSEMSSVTLKSIS